MTSPAEHTLVDGIDVDAVAAAVRGCPAVDDLDGGSLGGVATYLPGRRVPGIRIGEDRIELHVRGIWGQPVSVIAEQLRQALARLSQGRAIDVVLTDVTEPGTAKGQSSSEIDAARSMRSIPTDGTVEAWTKPSVPDAPSGGSSSAATTPTAAETRPSSAPA